ncbi:MAG: hypothetical protein IKM65_06375, partial [Bacteroidaceae bacterium]|nr:hypothetical protein [Bacteroidaceae bacterium]
NLNFKKLQRHVVLLCLYGMLSRIVFCFRFVEATTLLPESECKGTAFFVTTKQLQEFFSQKSHFFHFLYIFIPIITYNCSLNTQKAAKLRGKNNFRGAKILESFWANLTKKLKKCALGHNFSAIYILFFVCYHQKNSPTAREIFRKSHKKNARGC